MKGKATLPVMHLHEGAVIFHDDREYVIVKIADIDMLLVREKASGTKALIRLDSVTPPRKVGPDSETPDVERDLQAVSSADWEIAEQRLKWIQPISVGRGVSAVLPTLLPSPRSREQGETRQTTIDGGS